MKALKWIAIAIVAYIGLVVIFETAIGVLQPAGDGMLVITTRDGDGNTSDRVLSTIDSGGKLYVAASHWPRSWYDEAIENPRVRVALGDDPGAWYMAVPVMGAEYERVNAEHSLPFAVRVVTGFPPRRLLRLEPE